ncbi:DUF445 family protein [Tianweitania sp. BSSL-BM11]|uniref:DUF445 family protein n=1 Tax=Tianweitania aestuarii TaxID=2814886 RepID=A0ABS5RUP6_9HYPH|nr:DUF445 family protein [Tianweitania aestuarii]MBS9720773.1 DUF445 family protein [Tianweitania aestuarii]
MVSNAPSFPTQSDVKKARALRRVKALATAALALCVLVFVLCRIYADVSPVIGFIGAFAEAAAIGGLADWYAVVALFRHPLGLPIPHTAIIPSNQTRIADNLGSFIESNFLAPEPVRKKLQQVDFAALVADWLADEKRSEGLSIFVARLMPKMLAAMENTGLRGFLLKRVTDQLEKIDVAPIAADLLATFTHERRHQRLFDEMIGLLGGFLTDEDAQDALRDRIRKELPTLANFFRADAYLLKKILHSGASLIEDIKADDDHPMRHEFDRFVARFIDNLRHSPEYRDRAEELKRNLLARPELATLADGLWKEVRGFIDRDVGAAESMLRTHLTGIFVEVGRSLADDANIRRDMNEGFVVALSSFVESQKSGVSSFISEQVRSWDLGQLTQVIELNIGRDLQYIRFNGMAIGGLAGIALHTIDVLFLS